MYYKGGRDPLKVLAFDTTTSSCSIAILQNDSILGQVQGIADRGHAEALLPLIEQVLFEAKLRYQDLDLLAVTVGPGAFTGIRIGLATARSLALATKLPLIGITNFDALVGAIHKSKIAGHNVIVILETKRSDFYVCIYDDNLHVLTEPKVINGTELETLLPKGRILAVGDGVDRALPFIKSGVADITMPNSETHVDPVIVAKLAADIFAGGVPDEKPVPFYLKPPNVNVLKV